MAIEWYKQIGETCYEVRSAGATRRLYTNKVFHSQYNPDRVVQGGIWDLLALPAFAYPADCIQRVLVLGVGGGTVLRQLQQYLQPKQIIGIELNPVHIFVAKKFFGLAKYPVQLIEADAISWLENYQGEKFDFIIDDLFGHHEGEAERVISVNKEWAHTLLKHLTADGLIVVNFGSKNELKNSALIAYKKLFNQFKTIFRLSRPEYDNAIGMFAKTKVDSKTMRENFFNKTGLNTKNKMKTLSYQLKSFKK